MVLSIMMGAPAGYALSRFEFSGKEFFRVLVIMTRAFPPLALPFAVLNPVSVFFSIPVELEEAAWALRCTRLQAFIKVVLPLALPGIAASAVFAFVISWNDVFAAGRAIFPWCPRIMRCLRIWRCLKI